MKECERFAVWMLNNMTYYIFLKFLHIFGLTLGFGGAIFSSVLCVRSLRDENLFKSAVKVMPVFSWLIWVGLFLLFVSGVLLENFWRAKGINLEANSAELGIKKGLALFIAFHGIYVNLYLVRKMRSLALLESPFTAPNFKRFKIFGTISAIISLTLWTVAIILGIWMTAKITL